MMNRSQVVAELRRVQGTQNLRDFCEDLGISVAYLCRVYNGQREPGPKILEVMGLERTVTKIVLYQKKDKRRKHV